MVHLLPPFPSLPLVKILQVALKGRCSSRLFPLKSVWYAQNFAVLGRGLSDGSHLIHWLSDIFTKILLGSLRYPTKSKHSRCEEDEGERLTAPRGPLVCFPSPADPQGPSKKLKGATGHLCKPPL